MWDEREVSLDQQAIDATLIHAQALTAPAAAQVRQIVSFERGIFTAQVQDNVALALTATGAAGGATALSRIRPGTDAPESSVTAFASWSGLSGSSAAARRASIARGEALFTSRKFTAPKIPGFGTVSDVTCSTCHREAGSASTTFGQSVAIDIGVGGIDAGCGFGPDPTLPLFQLTCTGGASTEFNGSTVVTTDPDRALITGRCADIEKFKVPQLRALASRPPYFSNGQAKTLLDIVLFYDQRLRLRLSPQERHDLANFLAVL
jgi:cytochrome c peroxidase